MFISIEGIDGSGKSSVSNFLFERLSSPGIDAVFLREPGDTELGEQIRSILLNAEGLHICRESEMFLYFASRAQMIRDKIQPLLKQGKFILCDRFIDSTVAYQGAGLGLGIDKTQNIFNMFFREFYPDKTLLLDSKPELALSRITGSADRIEKRGVAYYSKVRSGFLQIAEKEPHRIKVINADVTLDLLKETAWDIVNSWIKS